MKKLSELFRICDDWHGYQTIGHDVNYKFLEEDDHLYVFFQGSAQAEDWRRNFMARAVPYHDMDVEFKVHKGFLEAWKEVEDVVLEKAADPKWKDITVVGYSHGASLCTLAVEDLWYWRPDLRDEHLHGFAFESPRVFAQWDLPPELAERWKNLLVIRTNDDVVTHVPFILMGYRNLGTMLKIKGDTSLVDKWYIPHCVKSHFPQVVMDALLKFEASEEKDEEK